MDQMVEKKPGERLLGAAKEMRDMVKKPGPGRPHSGKKLLTLRLEPEVIDHFRAHGEGWLQRVNDTLKRSMVAQQRAAAKKAVSPKGKKLLKKR